MFEKRSPLLNESNKKQNKVAQRKETRATKENKKKRLKSAI
jgi:hypothetical protein